MKRVPLLPNLITAFGLSCGLFVIFKMALAPPGAANYAEMMSAVAILLLAAFADVLDGAVARALKGQSYFGGIFDSMADSISFGVAPAVVVLKSLSVPAGTELSYLITTAAMVFSVCGVLRLVRFNCSSFDEPAIEEEGAKKNFTGLPIPAAAAAAVSADLFLISPDFHRLTVLSMEARAFFMFAVLILLGYLMISRWKFPAFKALHIRVSSFQMVFITAMTAVFMFYGILYHFAVAVFILAWAYVGVSFSLSLLRYMAGPKLETLAEFEPEPYDLEEFE
ncbi:MAG: CDP-alcohol phosphatidyltransferase family protein [Chlamydiales bacterium]|nr:CDP-alcohol phosphatidyltransferase family protein [Chlamydiales bacterium]